MTADKLKKFFKTPGAKVLAFVVIAVIVFSAIWVKIDFGINSKYHAKKAFNTAFTSRMTGNCDAFATFVTDEYSDEWKSACEDDRDRMNNRSPIAAYSIQEVTIDGEHAYFLVELKRASVSSDEIEPYVVNYHMKRMQNGLYIRWLVDQDPS